MNYKDNYPIFTKINDIVKSIINNYNNNKKYIEISLLFIINMFIFIYILYLIIKRYIKRYILL